MDIGIAMSTHPLLAVAQRGWNRDHYTVFLVLEVTARLHLIINNDSNGVKAFLHQHITSITIRILEDTA